MSSKRSCFIAALLLAAGIVPALAEAPRPTWHLVVADESGAVGQRQDAPFPQHQAFVDRLARALQQRGFAPWPEAKAPDYAITARISTWGSRGGQVLTLSAQGRCVVTVTVENRDRTRRTSFTVDRPAGATAWHSNEARAIACADPIAERLAALIAPAP